MIDPLSLFIWKTWQAGDFMDAAVHAVFSDNCTQLCIWARKDWVSFATYLSAGDGEVEEHAGKDV